MVKATITSFPKYIFQPLLKKYPYLFFGFGVWFLNRIRGSPIFLLRTVEVRWGKTRPASQIQVEFYRKAFKLFGQLPGRDRTVVQIQDPNEPALSVL